jgi:hypothetical protein
VGTTSTSAYTATRVRSTTCSAQAVAYISHMTTIDLHELLKLSALRTHPAAQDLWDSIIEEPEVLP